VPGVPAALVPTGGAAMARADNDEARHMQTCPRCILPLQFESSRMERNFSEGISRTLAIQASGAFVVAAITCPVVLCVRWFAQGRVTIMTDWEETVLLVLITVVFVVLAASAAICRLQQARVRVSPCISEALSMALVIMGIAIVPFMDGHYSSALLGDGRPRDSDKTPSDSRVLLSIVLLVVCSHAVFPVRAAALFTVDAAGLLLYGMLALTLGSPEGSNCAALNFGLLAMVVGVTDVQQWVGERRMRRAFTEDWEAQDDSRQWEANGNNRVESQESNQSHTSNRTSSRRLSSRRHLARAQKHLNSAPDVFQRRAEEEQPQQQPQQQTHSGGDPMEPPTSEAGRLFCDVPRNWRQIADLGKREKWLIDEKDLRMKDQGIMGTGAFGIVMAAQLHGTPVALKVPKQESSRPDLKGISQIGNELHILRHVRHPNIVMFHGACVDFVCGELVLVLELVQGLQLDRYILSLDSPDEAPGSTSLIERYAVLLGVCRALRYLHVQQPRIVHGDLKAVNIMVENIKALPRPKLLDFGLSRVVTRNAKHLGGTLAWMAPEVIRERRCPPSPATDVFSFGRLVYFVATSRLPMLNVTRQVITRLAKAGQAPPLEWPEGIALSTRSRPIVEWCLRQKPEERPLMAQVYEDFESWPDQLDTSEEETNAIRALTQVTGPKANGSQGLDRWLDKLQQARRAASMPKSAKAAQQYTQPQNTLGENLPPSTQALPLGGLSSVVRGGLSVVPEGESSATEDLVLAIPHLVATPRSTQTILILSTLLQLNFFMPKGVCCKYHAAIRVLSSLCREMNSRPCNQEFMPQNAMTVQCQRCGAVEIQDKSDMSKTFQCDFCGHSQDVVVQGQSMHESRMQAAAYEPTAL